MNKLTLFIFILLFSFVTEVHAIVKPTREFYVNDYANLLSSETEQYIINKGRLLQQADGTQIVVVTVENLEGLTIEDYALQLARNFGIGSAEKNNGLLLLLALEEREFRVEVGYGLEGILNDGKTGRFQDEYIIPYLSEDIWDYGIINGYNAFYSEIVKENNLNLEYVEPTETSSETFGIIICIMIFIGISMPTNKPKLYAKLMCVYILGGLIPIFIENKYSLSIAVGLTIGVFAAIYKLLKPPFFIGGGRSSFNRGGSSFRGGGFSSRGGGGSFGGGGSSRKF